MPILWTATLWLEDVTPADHETVGPARLIAQYRGDQPRLQGFLGACLTGLQSLENVTLEVLTGVWPLTAVGTQLDNLGRIVLQERAALTDDEYRLFILGRIFVNRGDGQLEQFYELLDILGMLPDAVWREEYPAGASLSAVDVTYPVTVYDLVRDLKGGGIRLVFSYSRFGADETFQASGTYAVEEYDAATGAGSVYDAATGGRSAGCFA